MSGPTGNEFHDKAIAEIWALFKESDARRAEAEVKAEARQAEAEARQAKAEARQAKAEARQAETNKQIAEMSKEISRLTRKLSKNEGQWGKITESLVRGELASIMRERFGLILDDASLRMGGEDKDGRQWEIDVIAVNSDVVVIVEVKTTLDLNDVKYFLNNSVNRFPTLVKRYRKCKVYAGVAYVRTGSNEASVVKQAEDHGLFVIKVFKNTNKIVNSVDFKLHDHNC